MKRCFTGVAMWLAVLFGCSNPMPHPHYELGRPYQVNGVWFYPAESFALDETGLAAVFEGGGFDFAAIKASLFGGSGSSTAHPPLTTDGEVFDQTALIAAHPTLQLPAIGRLTNLENGKSVLVRINDRGTGNPRRLVEVTRRVATLLGLREQGATQIRLQVLPEESRAAIEGLPGTPSLAVTTAPRGAVQSAALPPPSGMREESARAALPANRAPADAPIPAAPPARLPETVTQGPAQSGRLWVRLDAFEEYQYAALQRARVGSLGASIQSTFDGHVNRFWVRIGPLDTVRQADGVLDQALAAGIPDARIVVE